MKLTSIIIAILASIAPAFAQVSLTGFGTGDYSDASSGPQAPTFFSQTSTNATVSMNNDGQMQGTFSAKNITAFTSSLQLTATKTTNSTFPFSLELYDGSVFQTYTGTWNDFTMGSPSTATLSFGAPQAGFNFTNVTGMVLTMGGTSGQSVTVTLDQLTAVPEPSTYAAVFGLACLGTAIVRKHKRREVATV
jgi:hypothetical protein